ncbi:uncharacterized protein (TIGR03663 family) [Thermosporothrix hazakensis]|uniref:Uncharacterized protein (TIGR03663 family) n=1 Tax=Thermosporothrix hazakensis TaxID=644383 RepID=A0A326UBT6_THEHA|nr:flippase activity-associated protein Agl23 [Thermosporothrix hazakensis]PZW33029.1 uncharacterized protein (TIGR03663 family) [Thermosporothrix hazakensis]GCE49060.1 hypothetical protein KTH_39290 [Thermosporothrix hazakensis]
MKSYDTHSRDGVQENTPEQEVSLDRVEENREPDIGEESLIQDEEQVAVPEADIPVRPARGGSIFRPTREQLLNWLPFWGLILLGAILRFWGLGDKPLHHDESLHAYYSLQLMHNMENWAACLDPHAGCYQYNPLLHGPFQFHAIALVYKISQLLQAPDNGVNTFTVRIAAAVLGSVIIGLPYFLRDYLGKTGALLASFLLAVSPSMVYFSRFAREDIYMACFTFLLIVSLARYVRDRQGQWLILAAVAFALSYATKEATFLTVAIFGSFFALLVVWELGVRFPLRVRANADSSASRFLPGTWGPLAVALLVVIAAPLAKVFFSVLHELAIYTTDKKTQPIADAFVRNLKSGTVMAVPIIGFALGVLVLTILVLETKGKIPISGRWGLARRIDPRKQPVLDTILTAPWTHWFFALLAGWLVFLVLFTVLFTNIAGGIGDGIWQGLYYWLQQQQVARGEQPWYYYILLIPLYEQIGVVFGLVGLVRCLLRPNRFRLFLVYWFLGSFFIYSWAAEKMPWLMIHMTMPLMVLAAIGLEPAVSAVVHMIRGLLRSQDEATAVATPPLAAAGMMPRLLSIGVVALAILTLIPTLQNMYQVTYIHYADAPHEMMIYVQTDKDINTVMEKLDQINQKLYPGKLENNKRKLPVAVVYDAMWPFAWYLRDFPDLKYYPSEGCPQINTDAPVIIVGGDCLYSAQMQYQGKYKFHRYHLRTWWDEGYKPPPCIPSAAEKCEGKPTWGGVGPLLWLSYGDNPPPGATFDLGRAVNNVWQWWWYRKPIGSTNGSYDMGLFIRNDISVAP